MVFAYLGEGTRANCHDVLFVEKGNLKVPSLHAAQAMSKLSNYVRPVRCPQLDSSGARTKSATCWSAPPSQQRANLLQTRDQYSSLGLGFRLNL